MIGFDPDIVLGGQLQGHGDAVDRIRRITAVALDEEPEAILVTFDANKVGKGPEFTRIDPPMHQRRGEAPHLILPVCQCRCSKRSRRAIFGQQIIAAQSRQRVALTDAIRRDQAK